MNGRGGGLVSVAAAAFPAQPPHCTRTYGHSMGAFATLGCTTVGRRSVESK